MSSPVIVEAIRALIDRRDLTRLEAAAAMEALMSGAATSVQVAAFLTALRMKGETVEELIGLAEVMRLKAVRVRTRGDVETALAGTDREMLIDTAGPAGTRPARSTSPPRPRSSSPAGAQGGQARQPLGLEPVRVRGRGRDARREPRPHAGQGRAVHRPGGNRVPLRAAPAHRDEARDAGSPGDGDPHRLQRPRPADQPGRRQRAGHRRLQPRTGRAARASPGRARDDPRLRGARRRRPGRDLHDG